MIKSSLVSEANKKKSEEAINYVKKNKKNLIEEFASDKICPPSENPASFFMAGAPGAGKTETAISLIRDLRVSAIRIDPDEVKRWLPGYTGKESDVFHRASSLGIEKIYDHALKKRKSVVFDATFADYDISRKNIERSVKKGRPVLIFYVHQDSKLSWGFTLKREKLEGRHVPKNVFDEAFSNSGMNVVKIKREFGKNVSVCLIEKNIDDKVGKFRVNIGADELENYLEKVIK